MLHGAGGDPDVVRGYGGVTLLAGVVLSYQARFSKGYKKYCRSPSVVLES
jgi:hypothetical protein